MDALEGTVVKSPDELKKEQMRLAAQSGSPERTVPLPPQPPAKAGSESQCSSDCSLEGKMAEMAAQVKQAKKHVEHMQKRSGMSREEVCHSP